MALAPSIILAGQQPDMVNVLDRSNQAAYRANEMQRQNQLNQLYQQHGAGAVSGDQAAINALAAADPKLAMDFQQSHAAMRENTRRTEIQDQRLAMEVAKYKAGISEAQAKQEAEGIKRGVFAASAATTPEEWDAVVRQFGQDNLVGQFGQKDMLLRQFMTAAEILESNKPPSPQSGPGKVQADINAGLLPEGTPLRGSGVTVNTGSPYPGLSKLGEGMTYLYDEQGNIKRDEQGRPMSAPVPGTDAERERSEGDRRLNLAVADYNRKSEIVDSNIGKALGMLEEDGRWVAGWGSMLSGVPESAARDFQATLDTIKANLGFEELQNMRDSSPTGGALGQVTEKEIAFLQAMQGNLDAAQSPQQLAEVLQEIQKRRKEFAQQRLDILQGGAPQGGGGAASFQDMSPSDLSQVDLQSLSDEELDAYLAAVGGN